MKSKICSICKQNKKLNRFHKDKSKTYGKCNECKECRSKRAKSSNSKLKSKEWWLKRKFNITLEQYEEILGRQNGVCAICKNPEISMYKKNVRKLAVDHNHKTGNVRGLLCRNCNTALGCVMEDKKILKEMIKYLENYNG